MVFNFAYILVIFFFLWKKADQFELMSSQLSVSEFRKTEGLMDLLIMAMNVMATLGFCCFCEPLFSVGLQYSNGNPKIFWAHDVAEPRPDQLKPRS